MAKTRAELAAQQEQRQTDADLVRKAFEVYPEDHLLRHVGEQIATDILSGEVQDRTAL